jgi:beta-glucosidase
MASDEGDMIAGGGSGSVIAPYTVGTYSGLQNYVKEHNLADKIEIKYESEIVLAALLCEKSDVCITVVGAYSHEGDDRSTMSIPLEEELFVDAIVRKNNNTIVVIHSPAAVKVSPFEAKAAAIVCMGYPGQEDGNAFSELLFGDALPSGRLATTWPVDMAQLDFTEEQYPGVLAHDPCINGKKEIFFFFLFDFLFQIECKRESYPYTQATYSEGALFGYRWYVETGIQPQYAFGFGLTYTTFVYGDFHVDYQNRRFTLNVSNTGRYPGSEVVQLYVGYPELYNQPNRQLKGFQRTPVLSPGQSHTVFLPLPELFYWQVGVGETPATGLFTAYAAASALDVRASLQFSV